MALASLISQTRTTGKSYPKLCLTKLSAENPQSPQGLYKHIIPATQQTEAGESQVESEFKAGLNKNLSPDKRHKVGRASMRKALRSVSSIEKTDGQSLLA